MMMMNFPKNARLPALPLHFLSASASACICICSFRTGQDSVCVAGKD